MPEYRVTFGSQYGSQDYGADPHPVGGYDHVHRDGYWTIVAPDVDTARQLTVAILGAGWSGLYDPAVEAVDWSLFPRGELLRLTHPAMATQAVHLLTGPMPPNVMVETTVGERHDDEGRLLVTVWGDGSGEAAYRPTDDTHVTWGPPSALAKRMV